MTGRGSYLGRLAARAAMPAIAPAPLLFRAEVPQAAGYQPGPVLASRGRPGALPRDPVTRMRASHDGDKSPDPMTWHAPNERGSGASGPVVRSTHARDGVQGQSPWPAASDVPPTIAPTPVPASDNPPRITAPSTPAPATQPGRAEVPSRRAVQRISLTSQDSPAGMSGAAAATTAPDIPAVTGTERTPPSLSRRGSAGPPPSAPPQERNVIADSLSAPAAAPDVKIFAPSVPRPRPDHRLVAAMESSHPAPSAPAPKVDAPMPPRARPAPAYPHDGPSPHRLTPSAPPRAAGGGVTIGRLDVRISAPPAAPPVMRRAAPAGAPAPLARAFRAFGLAQG